MAQGYNVTLADADNCGLTVNPTTITEGTAVSRTITLALAEGKTDTHKLPEANDISIAMGEIGLTLNNGTSGFTYEAGVITLTDDISISADITITAAAVAKSTDAKLTALTYQLGSAEAVAVPEFTAGAVTYNLTDLKYTMATTVTLDGTPATGAKITTNEAATITKQNDGTQKATATISVTAEDGTTTNTYIVNFTFNKDEVTAISAPSVSSFESRMADKEAALAALNGKRLTAAVTTASGENVNPLAVTWTYDNSKNGGKDYDPVGGKSNTFTWTVTLPGTLANTAGKATTGDIVINNVAANATTVISSLTYKIGVGAAVAVTNNLTGTGDQTYAVVLPHETAASAALTVDITCKDYATAKIEGKEAATQFSFSLVEGKATLPLIITAEDGITTRKVTINFTTEAEQVTKVSGVPTTYTLSEPVADANAAIVLLEKMDMSDITLTANSGATLKLKWEYKGKGFDNGSGKTNEFTWTVVKGDGSAIAAKDGVTATDKITVTNYTASADAAIKTLTYQVTGGSVETISPVKEADQTNDVTVAYGTKEITVSITPNDSKATVCLTDKPNEQGNKEGDVTSYKTPVVEAFQFTITAEDGQTKKNFIIKFIVEDEKVTAVTVPATYNLPETATDKDAAIALLEKMEGVVIKTNGETQMKLSWAYNEADNESKPFTAESGKTNVFSWTVKTADDKDLAAMQNVKLTGKTNVTNPKVITGNQITVEISSTNLVNKIGDGKTETTIQDVTVSSATNQLTIDQATVSNKLTLNESVDKVVLNKATIKEIVLAATKSTTLSLQSGNQIDKITNNGTLTLQEAATPAVATLSMAIETRAALANTGAIKAVENNGNFTDNTASIVAVAGDADLSITSLPADKSTTGSKVTLSVGANSTKGSVSYQWQTYSTGGWTNMRGSIAKDLEISKTADGSTQYRCEVKSTVSLGSGKVTTLYTPAATVTFRAEGSGGEPTPTPTPKTYTVKLAKVTGATFSQKEETTVAEGDDFSFKITLDKAYDQSKPVVTVDGKAIAAAADGSYTIKNIRKDIEIVVSGIVKNTATGMEETIVDAARAWSQGSTLYIHVPEKADVYVFNASGGLQQQLQGASGDHSMQLRAGFYIVRIGVYTAKVIIR